jgi:hypothetical protein
VSSFGILFSLFPKTIGKILGNIFSSANSINFAKSFEKFYQIFIIKKLGKREKKRPLVHGIFTTFKASLSK